MEDNKHVQSRIERLKSDLLRSEISDSISIEKILQKHFMDRNCSFFSEIHKNEDVEYDLRAQIASECGVNINDVVIVGSAKVGFSVKTNKFILFDKGKDLKGNVKKSDIDVAIINGKLFDDVAYNIFEKSAHFNKDWIRDNWAFNRFNKFEEQKISNGCDGVQKELISLKNENARIRLFNQYTSYLARGWLRPDYMPEMFLSDWVCLSIAESWRQKLSRKVSIAVYSNWKFFKFYHIDHLTMLKSKMGLGVKIDE